MKIIVKEPAVYMVRAMFLSHLYYYRNSGAKRTEWRSLVTLTAGEAPADSDSY